MVRRMLSIYNMAIKDLEFQLVSKCLVRNLGKQDSPRKLE